MNKAILVGRLVSEPEARETQSGVAVTTFRMAIARRNNRDESDFLTVVSWRGLAENCAKFLVKGQRVAVLGRIETRSYETKEGEKRYSTEIQADDIEFLDKPGEKVARPKQEDEVVFSEMDEDLPF